MRLIERHGRRWYVVETRLGDVAWWPGEWHLDCRRPGPPYRLALALGPLEILLR